jgi:hypothetical protein
MENNGAKKILKDVAIWLLAERGVKAGVLGGLINGLLFLSIYLFVGVKELPIGIFSFSDTLIFVIMHILESAVFGVAFSLFYNFIPAKKGFYKAILLSVIFWFLLKLIPSFSLLTTNYLVFIETLARYLLMGSLVYIFWDTFRESAQMSYK